MPQPQMQPQQPQQPPIGPPPQMGGAGEQQGGMMDRFAGFFGQMPGLANMQMGRQAQNHFRGDQSGMERPNFFGRNRPGQTQSFY